MPSLAGMGADDGVWRSGPSLLSVALLGLPPIPKNRPALVACGAMEAAQLALFLGSMLLLTFLPTASSALVAAKSAADGMRHGLFIVLGIISVDFVFVLVVIFGLRGLIGVLQEHAVYLQYIGGCYLIGFGVVLWRGAGRVAGATVRGGGLAQSYRLGVMITAPDQNVLLFYLSVLPAIFDLGQITLAGVLLILLVVALSLLTAKMTYAWAGVRGSRLFSRAGVNNILPRVAAALIALIGVLLLGRGVYVSVMGG